MEVPDGQEAAQLESTREIVAREQVAWTTARRQLHERLKRDWPGLADAYHAAIDLLAGDESPGRDTLVCYALRDLINALTDSVVGEQRNTSFPRDALKTLAKLWPDGARADDGSWHETNDAVPVVIQVQMPWRARKHLQEVLQAVNEYDGRGRPTERMFLMLLDEPGVSSDDVGNMQNRWDKIRRSVSDGAHFNKEQKSPRSNLTTVLCDLECVLGAFLSKYFSFTSVSQLDEILRKANN